jgi:hypothetical protein
MAPKRVDKATQNNVALLAAHGASKTKISRQTGLHHKPVAKVLAEPSDVATVEQIEGELAEMFMDTSRRAICAISDDKLEKSSARDLGILAGVCIDKNRLIRGTSTENIAVLMARMVIEADGYGDG